MEYVRLRIGDLVVANPRGKDNCVLGTVKDIKTVDEYGEAVSAQIVGIVDMP